MRRGIILFVATVLVLAACGDDAAITVATDSEETTSTEAGEAPVTTEAITTATTEVPQPPGAAFIMNGETGPYVRALQTYLNCAGYGPVAIDGAFGDGTAGSVERAQADENKTATGEPDEKTFARLSRSCDEARDVVFGSGVTTAEVAGNAAPGDDEVLQLRVLEGQQMTVHVHSAIDVAIQGADGMVLHRPDGSTEIIVDIPSTQDYRLRVSAVTPTSYLLAITIPGIPAPTTTTMAEATGFFLAVDGFNDLDFGIESGAAMTALTDMFGPPSADTGWVPVEGGNPECADVERTVTWEFPATEQHVATTLDVLFHDRGFSNPAFAHYDYRLTNHEDRDQFGSGLLSTAHGLSVGDTYNEAVSHGFVLGGFEEMGHGQLDWIDVHVYTDSGDYEEDGFVGSIGSGKWSCPDPF